MRYESPSLLTFILLSGAFFACRPADTAPPGSPAALDLAVGLTEAESRAWRYTSEGSDIVPVDFLRALLDPATGKPFSQSLDRFGFLPSPPSPENPYGLPIGWTVDVPSYSLLAVDYVGLNCAACHTGELAHGGKALRIDGAPNMADLEAFALTAEAAVKELLADPLAAFAFVVRLVSLEPPSGAHPAETFAGRMPAATRAFLRAAARAPGEHPDREIGRVIIAILADDSDARSGEAPAAAALAAADRAMAEAMMAELPMKEAERQAAFDLIRFLRTYFRLLKSRADFVARALHAFATSTAAGPGGDDPWGGVRNLLFQTPTSLDSPVSIPHLFHAGEFEWYHADGNTTSVGQRNLAQAAALGAYLDPETGVSTLKPRQVWELEDLMAKLERPAWPEAEWGEAAKIDRAAAARGEELFHRRMAAGGGEWSCADCHQTRAGALFSLEVAGTDPNRARSFLRLQGGQPLPEAILARISQIETFTNRHAGIAPAEAAQRERNPPPRWRGTGRYLARKLDGVWATAPYLHNGSVPTLDDLLRPAGQRPKTFPLGHREYDLEKVGYRTTGITEPIFVFDVGRRQLERGPRFRNHPGRGRAPRPDRVPEDAVARPVGAPGSRLDVVLVEEPQVAGLVGELIRLSAGYESVSWPGSAPTSILDLFEPGGLHRIQGLAGLLLQGCVLVPECVDRRQQRRVAVPLRDEPHEGRGPAVERDGEFRPLRAEQLWQAAAAADHREHLGGWRLP